MTEWEEKALERPLERLVLAPSEGFQQKMEPGSALRAASRLHPSWELPGSAPGLELVRLEPEQNVEGGRSSLPEPAGILPHE